MNSLVYVGKITKVDKINEADFIEYLTIVCGQGGKWRGIAKKGQFHTGDLCEVYLQDSILPQIERFAFMEKHHNRVRMCKFKGIPSEVLIMPLTLEIGCVGDDLTETKGVTKYFKPIPFNITGDVYGNFPSFIPKTDEPNFQVVSDMVEKLRDKRYYATEKADGSSATIYLHKGHFGCCNRNFELKEKSKGNAIWEIAQRYDLKNFLRGIATDIALQFEVCGVGIQSNPMGLIGIEPRLFNIYDIEKQQYKSGEDVRIFSEKTMLPMVKIIDWDKDFNFQSDDELRKYAEGVYDNNKQREGVVIRPMEEMLIRNERVSFKVINLLYKGGRK